MEHVRQVLAEMSNVFFGAGEMVGARLDPKREMADEGLPRVLHFRALNAPQLCTTVYDSVIYCDGVRAFTPTRKLRAA